MMEIGGLRVGRKYVEQGQSEGDALLELQEHLMEVNRHFTKGYSLVLPKRAKRGGPIIGRAGDNNHLLYQDYCDRILGEVPKPLTIPAIEQKLIDLGEKKSTARLCAPAYLAIISKVLDPSTKKHRGSEASLTQFLE